MIDLLSIFLFNVRVLDIIDILLLALLLYGLYNLLKGTVAMNILIGIIALVLLWQLVKLLEMDLLSEILGQFISVGVIALIVVFQPEIRRFLLMLGTPSFINKIPKRFLFWKINIGTKYKLDIETIVNACKSMSKQQTGALIVLTLRNELQQYINSGEGINGRISESLINTIFFKNNPLHDGAMVILHNKIASTRCILPLSTKTTIPSELGLRHRAAMGITEQSDAFALVVSEQTGAISYSVGGELIKVHKTEELKKVLEATFTQA